VRRVILLAVLTVALGTGATGGTAASSSPTSLKITYWPDGRQGTVKPTVWTLRCNPARGTLRSRSAACRRLAGDGVSLFTPVPPDAVCTEIYGGPYTARITGTIKGKSVWATFVRTNGCHISRWDRVSPWLLPRVGTA
jgi:hypothetical protein